MDTLQAGSYNTINYFKGDKKWIIAHMIVLLALLTDSKQGRPKSSRFRNISEIGFRAFPSPRVSMTFKYKRLSLFLVLGYVSRILVTSELILLNSFFIVLPFFIREFNSKDFKDIQDFP